MQISAVQVSVLMQGFSAVYYMNSATCIKSENFIEILSKIIVSHFWGKICKNSKKINKIILGVISDPKKITFESLGAVRQLGI